MFRFPTHLTGPVTAALILAVATAPATAQHDRGTLIGTVLDEQTLRPLAGAAVSLPDTRRSMTTDPEGDFLFSDLPAGSIQIRISAPGYADMLQDVEVTAGEVAYAQFQIASVTAVLDAILVRGRRGENPRAEGVANAEIRVEHGEDYLSAADLLARRIPGVTVWRGAEASRGGGRILIRGQSSINLSNDPTILLNGIRISAPGGVGGMNQAFQVLNQIPASEVSRIRVLRGSAAGSLYSDSANGIILIETR